MSEVTSLIRGRSMHSKYCTRWVDGPDGLWELCIAEHVAAGLLAA